jgi:serine/threonine-protein kinase
MAMMLRELFDHASALPPAQRTAWLDANCPDPAARAEVERLLAADAAGTTTPQRDPLALAEAIGTPSTTLEPGARIGPFAVDALLGEGGSATVYRAHRDLDGVRQTVALKVLRRGLHAPEARRQFDRERQALAQLQHPHIAQFIDGGVSADGQAFLALEFVDGAPITTFARERALDFRRRIALMVDVARAVASAHRSLIVHRDLKPGNIFVTTDGHAKLLDFGIAKLLAEDTTEATQTQFRAFTPAYAAPEQRHGGVITTATDVYALGIVLGELVTGQRLTEGGTSTPSSRITDDTAPGVLPAEPKLTRRLVKGDLDNILMKALEEEPERRYATAAAFADDLERLLDGRPVSAHPPSGWYRAKKFVQRHRGGVAITALLSLAVLVSLAVAIQQRTEAQRQADNAMAEAERSRQVMQYLTDVFAAATPGSLPEDRPTPAQIVGNAAEQLLADQDMPIDNRLALLTALANVAIGLGEHERAVRLGRELLALGEARVPPGSPEIISARRILAIALVGSDRNRDAIEVLSPLEAKATADTLLEAQALTVLARAYASIGDDSARARADRIMDDVLSPSIRVLPISDAERFELFVFEAQFWSNQREFTKSLPLTEAAIAYFEHRGLAPTDDAVFLYATLAAATSATGDQARALAAYESGVALAGRLYPQPHPNRASIEALLGSFLVVRRELDRAEPLVLGALETRKRLLGPSHGDTLQSLNAAARLRLSQGRVEEGNALLGEIIGACEARTTPTVACVTANANLGRSYLLRERYAEAEPLLGAAVALAERMAGPESPLLLLPLSYVAELQQKTGRYAATLATVARIESIGKRATSQGELLLARSRRAAANLGLGDPKACANEMAEVEPAYAAMLPESWGERRTMLLTRARCAERLGMRAEAAQMASNALALGSIPFRPKERADLERIAALR